MKPHNRHKLGKRPAERSDTPPPPWLLQLPLPLPHLLRLAADPVGVGAVQQLGGKVHRGSAAKACASAKVVAGGGLAGSRRAVRGSSRTREERRLACRSAGHKAKERRPCFAGTRGCTRDRRRANSRNSRGRDKREIVGPDNDDPSPRSTTVRTLTSTVLDVPAAAVAAVEAAVAVGPVDAVAAAETTQPLKGPLGATASDQQSPAESVAAAAAAGTGRRSSIEEHSSITTPTPRQQHTRMNGWEAQTYQ
jgi:hypothetical protein